MKPVQLPGERIASAGAAALGLANVAYQAALTYRPTPDAVLAIAGALAPTLAILVAWWAPGRPLRLSMLVVAMLLELPALVIAGSALGIAVEALLVGEVVPMQSHKIRSTARRTGKDVYRDYAIR